jgi:hypothetical protein
MDDGAFEFIAGIVIGFVLTSIICMMFAVPTSEEALILVRGHFPEASYIVRVPENSEGHHYYIIDNDVCYAAYTSTTISPKLIVTEVQCEE